MKKGRIGSILLTLAMLLQFIPAYANAAEPGPSGGLVGAEDPNGVYEEQAPAETRADDPVDEDVANVMDLLSQIDSLQEMQDKKIVHPTMNEFNLKKPYCTYTGNGYNGDGTVNVDNSTEHKAKQQLYADYLENMFALRAQAKEAYDALTPEQQAAVLADETAAANYAKLTPYAKEDLETVFPAPYEPVPGHNYSGGTKPAPESVPLSITPSNNEYTFESTRSYEMSQNFSAGSWKHQAADYSIFTLVDVSGPATEWSPDKLYEYNNCNYLLAYCCDVNTLPHRGMHYKRINLEDSGYYSEAAAQHIRAITNVSYPFVTMDEMKEFLIENGYPAEKANALTRSDMISAVQAAIWSYANISSYLEPDYYENITHYGGTAEQIKLPDARWWLRTPTLHDYRNELWFWYNSNTFPMENSYWGRNHWTYYDDIQDRVDSLVEFLHDLPGVAPTADEIVISDVKIMRSAPVDNSGTYIIDLSIFLNHGAPGGSVTITITSSGDSDVTDTSTITVGSGDTYSTTITVKDGDRVDIVVDGTQVLPRGTYFYMPEVGAENSQALVGVAEGETKVHAEDHFQFKADGDIGLRVIKTVKGSRIPISDITFKAYRVDGERSVIPTAEEIAEYAVDENLAGTEITDSTGYLFMELPRGTYLIVEVLNAEKVKKVADPFYITVPNEVQVANDDGNITIEYEDVVTNYVQNEPKDIPGTVSVFLEAEKAFEDWGKADSFRFELEAKTAGAPMPNETIATATEDDPVAVFQQITYDAICFEEGDPDSNVRVFEYTITEINDHVPGVTYDTTPHAVKVTVTRSTHTEIINEYGDEVIVTEYTAEVKYDDQDSLIITNTFHSTKAHFEATKEFNDWGKADSFTFKLDPVTEGAPMPDVTEITVSEADPTAVFAEIEFETTGTWEYTITEIDDGVDGVTYDTEPHAVVVTVSADSDTNELSAKVTYDGQPGLIITNTFNPATAVIEVTKAFNDWGKAESFTFELAAVTEGAPMPKRAVAVATEAAPKAVFETLTYEKAGVYEYTVTEIDDGVYGVTYDTEPHSVIVTVTKGENNVLSAEVTYDGKTSLIITNTYEMELTEIEIHKIWDDDDDRDGLRPDSITVNLLSDGEIVDTVQVTPDENGDWSYTFTELPKCHDDGTEIEYTVTEEPVENYETEIKGYEITNRHVPELTEIEIHKIWDDDDDCDGLRPDSIVVNLLSDGEIIDTVEVTPDENGDWSVTFAELTKYRDHGEEIEYTVTEEPVENYETEINGYEITNRHVPELTEIEIHKIWDDDDNRDGLRPDSIVVNLLSDGEIIDTVEVTPDENGDWSYTFADLPRYRDGGVEIVYSISEETVTSYRTEIDGFTITNRHVPGTVDIPVTKTWDDDDNRDGLRPESITVNLLADGEIFRTVEIVPDEDGNWAYTFTGLPISKNGAKIVYSITEEPVENYESEVNGFAIINKYVPETTEIDIRKIWDDADDQDGLRPDSITVNLLADGAVIRTVVITPDENGDWKCTFTDLLKYRDGGVEIVYTVTEEKVDGYTVEIDGYTLTNRRVPATVEIKVEKIWVDSDNAYKSRPDSITIRLLADGETIRTAKVTPDADGKWTYTFKDLPRYKDGAEIKYTIEEDPVKGYVTSVNGYRVTNTFTPPTGDSFNPALMFALAGASLLGLAAVILILRRRRRED